MLLRRATALSSRCVFACLPEPTGQGTRRIQARFCYSHVRALPVFPELHDYPSSIPVSGKTETPLIPQYRIREVRIQTCGDLYKQWRKERKYWLLHNGPVTFDVKYLDTGVLEGGASDEAPVVLALHGSPGSYDDFKVITTHLYKNGARVIAPCFPGIETYRMGKFRHSPEEKNEYLKDFLVKINVSKIDMLVCHSASLFPGLLLSLESQFPQVKSLCLLNPTAFDLPSVMKPLLPLLTFYKMWQIPLLLPVADFIGRTLVVIKQKQLSSGHYTDHFLAAFTLLNTDIPERAMLFRRLVQMNMPILMVFSENDRLIAAKSSYKMAEMLVGSETEVHRFDANGKLVKPGGINPSKRALAFEKGSHFSFAKHPEIISEEVSSFLMYHFMKNRCEAGKEK